MTIYGTDHSKWDWTLTDPITGGLYYVPISYDVAIRNGSRYAFLKACDGTNDTPFYSEAIRDARAAGLLACPYLWLYARDVTSPKAQGEFWASRVMGEPLVVIDFETWKDRYGVSHNPDYDDLYGAIVAMQGKGYTGKIMIYTGHWYWLAHGSTADYWRQFPVWLARYYSEPPQDTPPWDTWTFWQYTENGDPAKWGVNNGKDSVDENRFEGTIEELQALFGGEVTPPPPQGEIEMKKVTVKANTLRVRSAPSAAAPILRYLKLDDVVYTPYDVETNPTSNMTWIRISEKPVEYLAVKDASTVFSIVEDVPGGQGLPVITFNLSADGYPAQVVTWTPS